MYYRESLQFTDFGGNENPRIAKPRISRNLIFGCICLLKLYQYLFIMQIYNYLSISMEKLAIFQHLQLKKLGFIAKCRHFEGFKKPRIANLRNSRPRIARTYLFTHKVFRDSKVVKKLSFLKF